MTHKDTLRAVLAQRTPEVPRFFSAPGRVNLIGEHTDYNDGFVLPIAIQQRTYVAAAPRRDDVVRVLSLDASEEFEFDLSDDPPRLRGIWLDYVQGTARSLIAHGVPLRGAELVLKSDVARGAGLSSSAALEQSVALALVSLAGAKVDKLTLALSGQAAEHAYVGTQCGLMDQYVSTFAQADHALLLDCRATRSTAVPLRLGGATLLVCDTLVRHQLASSEYNVRRRQCEEARDDLRRKHPVVTSLRDVTSELLEASAEFLSKVHHRRVRHVVTENSRVLAAAGALMESNLALVGRLFLESHDSLRHDYEVSSKEQDFVVDFVSLIPQVYGARMTGGGFGGCVVMLVRTDSVPDVATKLGAGFKRVFGHYPHIFPVAAHDGAREDELGDRRKRSFAKSQV